MGMPITVEVIPATKSPTNETVSLADLIQRVFDYFVYVDEKFSTYKPESEIMQVNRNELHEGEWSDDMKLIFALAEDTKNDTNGYFDILNREGIYDPSGIVKGWAILEAARLIEKAGYENYYVEAGGDIEAHGLNAEGALWRVGIRNPLKQEEIVKVVGLENCGIATSGTYIRGQHIYNPMNKRAEITDTVSLTVIGPNVYEADRFATAAFAMGKKGIEFIEEIKGLEGYIIDGKGIATMTSGFEKYVVA